MIETVAETPRSYIVAETVVERTKGIDREMAETMVGTMASTEEERASRVGDPIEDPKMSDCCCDHLCLYC